MYQDIATRRLLLRRTFGVLAGLKLSAQTTDSAESRSLERISVCIYLLGGNDSNNLVVPINQYASYAASRRSLALPSNSLLKSRDAISGSIIGFHPAASDLARLFAEHHLAVMASVGSQTREASHQKVSDLSFVSGGFLAAQWTERITASEAISGFPSHHQHSSLTFTGHGASQQRSAILEQSFAKLPAFNSAFPASPLGNQLAQVAATLASGATTGIRQRSFFAVQAGYDTHSNQLPRQAALLSDLSASMAAFYAATKELGLSHQITTYTDSDFGRTLKPNSLGGSEHAWASHQLVMGGAVTGGRVFGEFPSMRTGGIWRPQMTKGQLAAQIAKWAGASDLELASAFAATDARFSIPLFHS